MCVTQNLGPGTFCRYIVQSLAINYAGRGVSWLPTKWAKVSTFALSTMLLCPDSELICFLLRRILTLAITPTLCKDLSKSMAHMSISSTDRPMQVRSLQSNSFEPSSSLSLDCLHRWMSSEGASTRMITSGRRSRSASSSPQVERDRSYQEICKLFTEGHFFFFCPEDPDLFRIPELLNTYPEVWALAKKHAGFQLDPKVRFETAMKALTSLGKSDSQRAEHLRVSLFPSF